MLKPQLRSINTNVVKQLGASPGVVQRVRGRALMTRRERWFRLHPLCVKCSARDLVRAATQLDHILPLTDGGSDDPSNWQGLCDDCHEAKTSDENRRRARGY